MVEHLALRRGAPLAEHSVGPSVYQRVALRALKSVVRWAERSAPRLVRAKVAQRVARWEESSGGTTGATRVAQ
jgi:hypothetical protein